MKLVTQTDILAKSFGDRNASGSWQRLGLMRRRLDVI